MHTHTRTAGPHVTPAHGEPISEADHYVRHPAHWGLFFWRGDPRHRRLPDDPVAWLSAPREVRYGCCATADDASQWAWSRLSTEGLTLSGPEGDTEPEQMGREIADTLRRGHDVLIKRILERDQAWALAVVSSPLCLTPASCRTTAP